MNKKTKKRFCCLGKMFAKAAVARHLSSEGETDKLYSLSSYRNALHKTFFYNTEELSPFFAIVLKECCSWQTTLMSKGDGAGVYIRQLCRYRQEFFTISKVSFY